MFGKKLPKYYYFIVPFCIALLVSIGIEINGLQDSDYYWHTVLGKYICENFEVPKEDVFSWIGQEMGLSVIAHSWLSSVILYQFSRIGSNAKTGALLFVFLSVFLYVLFILKAWAKSTYNIFAKTLLAFVLVFPIGWIARPKNLGLFLFAVSYLLLLDAYENKESDKWVILPIVSLLWANIHGGAVPILFAFTGLFLIISLLPTVNKYCFVNTRAGNTLKENWRAKRFIALLPAEMLFALINPYRYKLFIYFFVTNNETTKKYVSEWQPAYLGNSIVVAIIIVLFAAAVLNQKMKLYQMLPVLCCIAMCMKYVRIQDYLIITATPMIFDMANNLLKQREARMKAQGYYERNIWLSKYTILSLCLAAGLSGYMCYLYPKFVYENETQPYLISDTMTEEMKALNLKRMYTTYDTGGIVLYQGFQNFIDSSGDKYPDNLLEDAILFSLGSINEENGFEKFLEAYDFDSALLEADNYAAAEVLKLKGWTKACSDEHYILYLAPSSEAINA